MGFVDFSTGGMQILNWKHGILDRVHRNLEGLCRHCKGGGRVSRIMILDGVCRVLEGVAL